MNNQSITITGLIIILVGFLLERSGIVIAPDKLQTTIEVLIQISGLIVSYWGRYRQGDIQWYGGYSNRYLQGKNK